MTIQQKIRLREKEGNLRALSPPLPVDFASNDYLGFSRCLHRRNEVVEAWQQVSYPYGGATGSRLLTGNYPQIEELESQVAAYHAGGAALIFGSGYCANVGLLSCIATADDVFLYDAHIHASSIDGMRLSSAKRKFSWRHNDVEHLEKRLKMLDRRGEVFVLVESLYSCDGSLAPLEAIYKVCEHYDAKLIVDEAHATGVFGKNGAGFAEDFAKKPLMIARVHTFSKAIGSFGGVVVVSKMLKQYLINFSRPFIYATALPLPIILTVKHAYDELPLVENKRRRLMELIDYFKRAMKAFELLPSNSQIQSLIVPGALHARMISKAFVSYGFDVRALCYPTVSFGHERLRFCLHSFNDEKQIDCLVKVLKKTMEGCHA